MNQTREESDDWTKDDVHSRRKDMRQLIKLQKGRSLMATTSTWSNTFHAADIVEIDTGERTILPQPVLEMNGRRGRISEVSVGYDIYETPDCVGRKNDTWFQDADIPNVTEGNTVHLSPGIIVRVCVETLIPDTLHKVYHYNLFTGEDWFLYYRKRKYLYAVEIPAVRYPLFGEPVTQYMRKVTVEEAYLRKVGTLFDGTPLIEALGFMDRLRRAGKTI